MTATENVDVVIVGAGISGIGAAYRIHQRNPALRYVILERRAQIGGTWDLFRYPGVRSDSSIYSLSFPWEPWTRKEDVADGTDIREYLAETAHKYGIDDHVRFGSHVQSADWDGATDTWTVRAIEDGVEQSYRARFVFFGSGYYSYDQGYTPDFPGLETFAGILVHPQFWPEDLDYAGKRVVVIGSGATAVTLIPELAKQAASVTMLQRSPTWMLSMPSEDPVARFLDRLLPRRQALAIALSAAYAFGPQNTTLTTTTTNATTIFSSNFLPLPPLPPLPASARSAPAWSSAYERYALFASIASRTRSSPTCSRSATTTTRTACATRRSSARSSRTASRRARSTKR